MKAITMIFASLLVLSACKKEVITPNGQTNDKLFPTNGNILFLGDSRVEGGGDEYASYRYEMWKNLVDKGWSFDLIGTRQDDGTYPAYSGQNFDPDHEGTGGAVTKDILKTVKKTVKKENVPNLVLLGIGGNDLTGGQSVDETVSNLNEIIDQLQACNPYVVIVVEQIAPGKTDFMTSEFTTAINDYNAQIPGIATNQTNENSFVISVDMNSNWTDAYMADDVHYNDAGAKEIADRYMAALEGFFLN